MMLRRATKLPLIAGAVLALGSCGGGGGGGGGGDPVIPPSVIGVSTGFTGDLNWSISGEGGAGGIGAGGDGEGGLGAGGDFGQFRGALVRAYFADGTLIGEAPTDETTGMVTIRPGRTYQGPLCIELRGTATATYYEEGRDRFVPFPPDRVIRVRVPRIDKNIGITPFTEAAYRFLHGGNDVPCTQPAAAEEIRAANESVRAVLNQQFPRALEVDDITRLPFIKSSSVAQGAIGIGPRGRYGLVNGAFSKQAAMFASGSPRPTLDAADQLAEDLVDGVLDGRKRGEPAVEAGRRTYDPNTLTGELSSALAQQAERFGSQAALDSLPRLLNFGNTRYQGYLFDGSIDKDGRAFSTVAGWVAGNELGLSLGASQNKFPAGAGRIFSFVGNHGHGGGFFKTDATGAPKVYALGDNVNGELGTGDTASTNGRTVEIDLPGALTHVAGGFAHTVARLADGSVYAWGDNSFGQLGADPATLPRSLTPRRVPLPAGAVAVAATNMASFALLVDGTVHAWGDSAGFGVLGNGSKTGTQAIPARVPGLTDVVQISARDNDVLVLRRDHSLWQWGSFPADVDAFTDGDVTAEYRGGRAVPTRIAGLPAGARVRKILTEQGLSVALLTNGHVYTWGVYFDITAGQILRDLNATRVLGLPPVRDLMPGGFNGYGVRAFDRMTALGIDYRGGMWKIRGRVAEQFDPANPAQQRRPQGQAPRPDCASCHLPLSDWPLSPPAPTGTEVCDPNGIRPDVHGPRGANSLVHAETECEQCHNPARNPPIAAFPQGWLTCVRPTDLPRRAAPVEPPLIENACTIPLGHVFTPPGTVCASCHNSVVARPLQSIGAGCAQPRSSALPSIATTAQIVDARDDDGAVIAPGSTTRDATPALRGTLSAALQAGERLSILRNGVVVGQLTPAGTNWSFTDAANTQQGPVSYVARVTEGAAFGPTSNAIAFVIDSIAPAFTADVTTITDDTLGPIPPGGFASDTTPRVAGTIGQPLGAGEQIELRRSLGAGNFQTIATFVASGTTWAYTEPAPLAAGTYWYRARIVDAAGNAGAFGNPRSVVIVTGLPAAAITRIDDDAGAPIASGSATTDDDPQLSGTVSAALTAGQVVRVLRNGVAIGTAGSVGSTSWSFADTLANDGSYAYTARVEAGAVSGATSAAYALVLDRAAPTQEANVTQASDDFGNVFQSGGTTTDTTPTVSGTVSAGLADGERVRVLRDAAEVARVEVAAGAWSYTEAAPLTQGSYVYTAQVVDAAGNLGPVGSAGLTLTVNPGGVPLAGAATTIVSVNGIAPVGSAIPVSNDATPTIAGTIERALNAGERVRIYRDQQSTADATVNGTSWSYTSPALGTGDYAFRAQIEQIANPAVFGLTSASILVPVDVSAPTQVAAITGIAGVVDQGYTTDTTPLVQGTLSAPLGAGEQLQVRRNGAVVATQGVAGTTWSYQEGLLAGQQAYVYTANVIDAAGNLGPASSARTVNIVTNLPAVTAITVNGSSVTLTTNDTTPTIGITLGANLPASYVVRVYRNGSLFASLSSCSPSCSVGDTISTNTSYAYTAQTAVGPAGGLALGAISATRTLVLDTVAPAAPSISGLVNNKPYQNNTTDGNVAFSSGATVGDRTPQINVSFPSLTGTGETVALDRWNGLAWSQVASTGSGTSLSYNQPASFNAPPSAPSANPGTQFYRARRTDAAGNVGTSSTFQFGNFYLACSQSRAIAKSNNTTHTTNGNWTANSGVAACSGCHTTTTANGTNYVTAPPSAPTGSGIDQYWCSKS